MDVFLKLLSSVFKHITPLKTFLIILCLFSFIAATVVWENRQQFYTYTTDSLGIRGTTPVLALSDKSKRALNALVQSKDQFIVAGSAMGIDVSLNTRHIVYRYFNDKQLEIKVRSADAAAGDTLPLFTNNEIQNKQILSLLQGEFTCSKTLSSGIDSRYGNDFVSTAPVTCRVPIPPAYGHLIGYIIFHLSREPNENELDELRTDAYTISMSIYDEILKQTGPVKRID